MNKKMPETIKILLREFTNEYASLLESLTGRDRNHLLYHSSLLFSKWYCSAILNDTVLSPSNITAETFRAADEPVFYSIGISHVNSGRSFDFSIYRDYAENSTFLNDLKTLCRFCRPSGSLFPQKQSWFNKAKLLRGQISLDDPYYINYLLEMALFLGLIEEMPSIGTTVYRCNEKKCSDFFSLSVIAALKKAYDAAIKIFIRKTIAELQLPPDAISYRQTESFLKESNITDDLLASILAKLGISYEHLTELAKSDELNDDEESLVASVIFLGGALAKWLFVPLGTYMRLINPLYSFAINFHSELDCIRPFMHLDCDLTSEIFSCCNYFTATPLGDKIIKPINSGCCEKLSKANISVSKINEILGAAQYYKNVSSSAAKFFRPDFQVYKFKAYFKNDTALWKTFEISDNSSLADLAKTIDAFFGIFDNSDYVFYYNQVEYVSRQNKRSLAKADAVLLENMKLENGEKLLYFNPYNKNDVMVIKLISSAPPSDSCSYPRLLRQSKKITENEKSDF